MATDNPVDALFRFFSPTIRFPASGDIGSFRYAPYTDWEAPSFFRGNDAIERTLYREVASPGTQLGILIDAVKALAEHVPELAGHEAITALQELGQKVDSTKQTLRDNNESSLRNELEQLKHRDKDALQALLKEYAE